MISLVALHCIIAHAQFKLWCCKMLFLRAIFSIIMMFLTWHNLRFNCTSPFSNKVNKCTFIYFWDKSVLTWYCSRLWQNFKNAISNFSEMFILFHVGWENVTEAFQFFNWLFLCFKCCSVNTYMWNQCWHSVHCIQSILPFPLRAVGGEVSWHMWHLSSSVPA